MSSDYRIPNNDYLFNSRFSQKAIKFSIAHKYKKVQNIFRYHFHNEIPGIPAHSHSDPADVDLEDITSSSLDLKDGYRLLTPYQLITNQLFLYNFF